MKSSPRLVFWAIMLGLIGFSAINHVRQHAGLLPAAPLSVASEDAKSSEDDPGPHLVV